MRNYPSDITQEAFEVIRRKLEQAKKRTKPRKIVVRYFLRDTVFAGLGVGND